MSSWHVGIYRKKVLNIDLDKLLILFNPLNAELNPICHLLALVGPHHILHVSRIRVNVTTVIWQLVITLPYVLGAN
jgi:hypothetical protein